MLCKKCNAQLPDDATFCAICGAQVEPTAPEQVQPFEFYENVNFQNKEITVEDLPDHLKPMSAWSYFWLQILYSVPIVGFIFLMIFTFSSGNINRRSFTRSYWCAALVGGIIATVIILFAFILTGSAKISM